MPRPSKPRLIGAHTEENMKEALKNIRKGMSVRKASKLFGIPFTTLRRYNVKRMGSGGVIETMRLVPNYEVNKVFNDEQEKALKEYYKYCSLLFYGLTVKESRRVAYQMAAINNLKMPESWKKTQMAGKEWLRSFRRRHSDLSLRKPEPCSLARATAFNKVNVEKFYNNLETLLKRNADFSDGTRIFNLDETSTTTVQKPQRVIAPKGRRNVGKVTSGERGTLVTTCCIISASGVALPPVMVFPRKNFKNFMVRNTPTGTLGLAAPSGWMNAEIFVEVIRHFIKHTNSTPEHPTILIMDNHESHLSIDALDLAKAAGVHILTLHPHTSGKLQPLDVGIYGPFKTYYNAAIDSWLLQNPGKPVTIYDVGELVGKAFLKVMTPVNIINSFKKCGIFPFDRNLFDEADFLPSSVTDRPNPNDEEQPAFNLPHPSNTLEPTQVMDDDDCATAALARTIRIQSDNSDATYCEEEDRTELLGTPLSILENIPPIDDVAVNRENTESPSILTARFPDDHGDDKENANQQISEPQINRTPLSPIENQTTQTFISPFDFRKSIKAGPRKSTRKPRKLGRSMIATDTPEKKEIELLKSSSKKKPLKKKSSKKNKAVKQVLQSDSDEEDQDFNVPYQESDEDDWAEEDFINSENKVITENDLKKPLPRRPREGEYVLVRFATKKKLIYYIVDESTPRDTSLNAYLRYTLALPGTKAMCHEGGCGACVVSVRARRPSGIEETFSVNSCLVLVFSCHGWDITTIEGVGSRHAGYSDVQKRIAAFNGSQCGYCTPGWVMHMTSLQDKHLTMAELERSFGSNTCRCTGFRPILDAMKSFAIDASADFCQKVSDIEDLKICSKTNSVCERRCSTFSDESDWSVISDHNLEKLDKKKDKMMAFSFGKQKYFKIYDMDDVFDLLNKYGEDSYMFVDGNTGKGTVETFEYPRILIDISGVKNLKTYNFDQNLILGANMALEDCITLFKETAKFQSEFSYLAEFVKHFELIAHMPVRKIGSLAGNLMLKHASPAYPSDLYLLLETVGAVVVIKQSNGKKMTLSLLEFLKYDMRGKLMVAIELPPFGATHVFRSYKIMPRNQNALAIVNAAFLFKINPKTKIIEEADICYGNISPTFVHARSTEAFLKGKMLFNNEVLQAAIKILNKEIVPKYDLAQPSSEFRKKLAIGLFYKVVLNICPPNALSPRYRSGANLIQRPLSHGSQEYQTDSSLYPLNQPVVKLEAAIQAAGEARYANDIPPMPREVFGAFVQATVHAGELDKIDSSEVLNIEGVIAVYTAKDIPGVNSFGVPGFQLQTEEEEIIVSKNILFYGQPVGIVVANSEALAVQVAKKVKVTYKNVPSTAPVLTIDQAKKDSKRYVASDVAIEPKGKGTDVKKVIKGVYEIEGQYHYYMEPVTCVVVPVDQGLEVYDSTQWMDLAQRAISRCLNMTESDIHFKVRRIGGGFGGKISRNVRTSTACALVAKLLNTPCRFVVPLQTNLATAGGRLPCQCEYEVGVDDTGKIQYLNAKVVEDNGCSNNENILSYAKTGFVNCYVPDYFDVKMATVTTDTPSNTFARAPGTSEGMACIEHIMEHIAFAVQKDPTDVRIANMRSDDNDLPSLIDLWKKDTDYDKRLESIQQFNKANRWMKKAIKINVMSFPVEYYGNYSAMVSIYRGDGSVTVTTGGVEMGQGVNTKVAQVVAYKLGIPLELVTVLPNYSFVAANNVFSGSSIVSESVCYSAIRACDTLNGRLQPIRAKMSNASWSELVMKAGDDEIDLTATYMMTDKESDLKAYSAFAVAILEVQLDVLTARYEILRCDILEDAGLSVNPTIDISQVEGAYVQGLGYFTTEKLVRDPQTGRLLSNRSLTYHVPLALDIPADFRVKLRYNSKNKTGVLGSKAVGEMGICTAHGITHVLRQCILESRADSCYDTKKWINIDIPYDAESIMTALDVKLEEFLLT